jgi:DNA-binding SARP family transcriptional activator
MKFDIVLLRKCLKDMLLFVQEQNREFSKMCFEGLIESLHKSLPSKKRKLDKSLDRLKTLEEENEQLKLQNFQMSLKMGELSREMSFILRLQNLYKQSSKTLKMQPSSSLNPET